MKTNKLNAMSMNGKRSRIPRKLKKVRKSYRLVIFDLASLPNKYTVKKIVEEMNKTGNVFYDSTNGTPPRIVNLKRRGNKRLKNLIFKDISSTRKPL